MWDGRQVTQRIDGTLTRSRDQGSLLRVRICDNTFRNVRANRSNAEVDLTTNVIRPDEQA